MAQNSVNIAAKNIAQVIYGYCAYRLVVLQPVNKASADIVLLYKFIGSHIFLFQRIIKRFISNQAITSNQFYFILYMLTIVDI